MENNYNLLWLINYLSNKSPILGTFHIKLMAILLLLFYYLNFQEKFLHDGFTSRGPHATLTKGKTPSNKPTW